MSRLAFEAYYGKLDKLKRYGGSRNETSIRTAFIELIDAYCQPLGYLLVPEVEYPTAIGAKVYPDGTVKDAL